MENLIPYLAQHTGTSLTSVFSPQSQHETQRKGFGPGHLCSVDQQAKEVGLVRQREALNGLESGAHVQKACVILTAQEATAKQGQRQMFGNLSYRNTEGKDK